MKRRFSYTNVGMASTGHLVAGAPGKLPAGRLGLLLGLVLIIKLLVIVQLRAQPLLQPDAGLDTTAYVELARRVVGGDLALGPGLYYVSPLYIYFLAAALTIADSFTWVRVLQALLGTVSVGLVFLTARAWFGLRAGWLAAGAAALTGLLTFYESLILQASIDGVLTSAALLCVAVGLQAGVPAPRTRGEGRRQAQRWMGLAGVVFGLAVLNRPNMAFGAAGIALALLALQRFKLAAALAAGVLLGMAPVAVRNLAVSHQWSWASSHGGLNFYIGNGEGATGFFRPIPGITPNITGQASDARRVAGRALGRTVNDAETSDYFFGLAWQWIRDHPADAITLFARKLGYVFSAQHIALPHSYPFYAYDAGTLLRFLVVGPWLLLPLGIVGLLFAPVTRRGEYVVWAAFVPAYAIGVAAFFVAERYRLPLLIPMCIAAGGGIDAAIRAIAARRAATLTVPALVLAAGFVLVNWPHALHDGRWEEGLRVAERLAMTRRYAEADEWVRRLEANAPRPGAAHYTVGLQLLASDQDEAAVRHLTRAHELDPDNPRVTYSLGQALMEAGRPSEAVQHLRRGFDSGIALPLGGYDLAAALHASGDSSGAAAIIRRIQLGDQADPEAWLKVGRLAMQVKVPDAAEPFFRQAVSLRPDEAGGRMQLGLNLLVLEKYEDAVRELSAAVRLDPRDPDAVAHLAFGELRLGRLAESRAHAEAALRLDPTHPMARSVAEALVRR